MSVFVGNTSIYKNDVRSKYRQIEEHDIDDILTGDDDIKGDVVKSSDYNQRISDIGHDLSKALSLLKTYNTLSDGIDEIEILVEKLY